MPPATVLDELNVAFGGAPRRSPPPAGPTAPAPAMPEPAEPGGRSAAGETSPSIIAASLVPEQTKHSERRSRREAKSEAKRAAKRVAANERDAKRRAKQARRAAKKGKSPLQPEVDGSAASDDEQSVRIIAGPPTTGAAADAAARSTVSIDDDDAPDPVYLEGDLGHGGSATLLPGGEQRSTVFIDDRGPGTGEIVTIDVATSAARMEPRIANAASPSSGPSAASGSSG